MSFIATCWWVWLLIWLISYGVMFVSFAFAEKPKWKELSLLLAAFVGTPACLIFMIAVVLNIIDYVKLP